MRNGLLVILMIIAFGIQAQEKKITLDVNGYVRDVQGLYFIHTTDSYLMENLIHNRINSRLYIGDRWTLRTDLRNRIITGDLVRSGQIPGLPTYGENIEATSKDYLQLGVNLVDDGNFIINSTLDRLYLEYSGDSWNMRLGRQRINWGISNFWNPNDVFNAFAYTDFDYPERPGRDALRIGRYIGDATEVEVVSTFSNHINDATIGIRTFTNLWGYDMQFITGYDKEDIFLGGGWAGNIKDAGYKGEFTFFSSLDSSGKINPVIAMEWDYAFEKGLYLSAGFLYNDYGTTSGTLDLFNYQPSAKSLWPYKWAIVSMGTYPVSPRFTTSLAVIYSPVKSAPLFLSPTLAYNISQSWDLELIGQIFSSDPTDGKYGLAISGAFIRLGYSF